MAIAAVAAMASAASCGGDPFNIPWTAAPDTVLLYSMARPELNLPSAFNFNRRTTVRVEAPGSTGNWDLALDTRKGKLVFLPPRALGVDSRARIASFPGMRFDELLEAPSDTTVYTSTEPVPVELNTVYVVRTGRSPGAFGRSCVYSAKLEPLDIDVEGGTLTFVFDSNPVCNSLALVPSN